MRHCRAALLVLALGLVACQEDLTETKPANGAGERTLSRAELRWCMFNDIRIEAARGDMPGAKQGQIQAFNAAVQEWNEACRRYRYSRSDRDSVQRQIEAADTLSFEEWRQRYMDPAILQ